MSGDASSGPEEAGSTSRTKGMADKLLGSDTPIDLLYLLSSFAAFWVLDRLTIKFAALPADRLFSSVLVHQAALENVLPLGLLGLGVAVSVAIGGRRLLCRWEVLDHGRILRALGCAVVFWLAWRTAAYDFNFVLDRWHAVDRGLVLALAIGSFARPVFLVPFVAQARVVNGQFSYPIGSEFGQVIDGMMMMILVVLGVALVMYAITGRRGTSAVLLLWSTIVAAHLFEPGRAKLAMGWLQDTDVSDLAFNSYTAGWMGRGDGLYAQRLGLFIAALGWPLRAATVAMEAGALAAVAHPRLFRVWLPMAAAFHAATFALTGFFFPDWLLFELALCLLLWTPGLRGWVAENATPARAAIAMMAVAGGATLYHAPALAWLDAPVGYGYQVGATGRSGQEYNVPLSAFAPFEQEMVFAEAEFSPLRRVAGGFGAMSSAELRTELKALSDISELEGVETRLGPVPSYPDSLSERLLTSFFRRMSSDTGAPANVLNAPSRFWSGRPPPTYQNGEPLEVLRITLVASLTVNGAQQRRRTPVITISKGLDGEPRLERHR